MLSTSMMEQLNNQINLELSSSMLYLQMSAWCDNHRYEGCAKFMRAHAHEEMNHMHRLFKYLSDTGAMPTLKTIEAPIVKAETLKGVFEQTIEHEKFITNQINQLVDFALTQKDYSTFNFLQWYVAEQHEEERLFSSILDKISLVGESGKSLYIIDNELGKDNAEQQFI
jgi:ferritin